MTDAAGTAPTRDRGRWGSGLRTLEVVDEARSLRFPVLVQYPTSVAATGVTIGPYRFEATRDAPVADGRHPLIVLSHGGGGSHLLYRSIATHLACEGYVVASLEHPQDNRNDRTLVNTDEAAARRSAHASLAIDAVLADAHLAGHADASRVAAIGHSMGGLTALCLVGGQPWSASRERLTVHRDPRVRAAVLLAPASDWFMAPDSLVHVRAPLLVYVAERDVVTPPARIRAVLAAMPTSTPCEVREVTGGGHFAFLTPFPEAMRRADFPPSQDPPGFDRDALHRTLPGELAAFFAAAFGTVTIAITPFAPPS